VNNEHWLIIFGNATRQQRSYYSFWLCRLLAEFFLLWATAVWWPLLLFLLFYCHIQYLNVVNFNRHLSFILAGHSVHTTVMIWHLCGLLRGLRTPTSWDLAGCFPLRRCSWSSNRRWRDIWSTRCTVRTCVLSCRRSCPRWTFLDTKVIDFHPASAHMEACTCCIKSCL